MPRRRENQMQSAQVLKDSSKIHIFNHFKMWSCLSREQIIWWSSPEDIHIIISSCVCTHAHGLVMHPANQQGHPTFDLLTWSTIFVSFHHKKESKQRAEEKKRNCGANGELKGISVESAVDKNLAVIFCFPIKGNDACVKQSNKK